jgi:hypothetical protein
VAREKGGQTVTKVFISEACGRRRDRLGYRTGLHGSCRRSAALGYVLHDRFLTKRINHEWAYSDEGVCTNDVESFFSRVRRAEIGIHHHIAGPYFASYVAEMAWREDNRRVSNGEQYLMTTAAALRHAVSRMWKGYWQERKRRKLSGSRYIRSL